MGGGYATSHPDDDVCDASWMILSGESWVTSVAAGDESITGTWVEKKFASVTVVSGSIHGTSDITLKPAGGDVWIHDGSNNRFRFDAGSVAFHMIDDTNASDYFKISVTNNGDTTFTTVDNDGTIGHLNINPDGDLKIAPAGGQVMIDGDLYLYGDDGYTDMICQIYDSTSAGVLLLKDGGSTKIQLNTVASGISYFNNGPLLVGATSKTSHTTWFTGTRAGGTDAVLHGFMNESTSTQADCLMLELGVSAASSTTSNMYIVFQASDGRIGRIAADGSGGITFQDAFTGAHPTVITTAGLGELGMIVQSTGNIWAKSPLNKGISTGIPKVELTTTAANKRVYGVIADVYAGENEEYGYAGYVRLWGVGEDETHILVNSIGEGLVLITNINGEVENGDYITSSDITGLGQKQDSDALKSSTVAKCVETVDWSAVTDTVTHNGQEYKKVLAACTYHCG
jgi:hypothetical protein